MDKSASSLVDDARRCGRGSTNWAVASIDILIEQRFLRKRYRDAITGGEFVILRGGLSRLDLTNQVTLARSGVTGDGPFIGGGISGVFSASSQETMMEYKGRRHYNEWAFVYSSPSPSPTGGTRVRATRQGELERLTASREPAP